MDHESIGPIPFTGTVPSETLATQALTQFIAVAEAAFDANPNVAHDCIMRCIALLQSRVSSSAPLAARTGGLAHWQANRVSAYISANLQARIRAHDLAATLQLSVGHFSRAFRQTFGQAPKSYVTSRRVLRAQELLIRSREPLAQVALQCGLSDQSHFTRVFRRVVGVTPGAWRRQHGMLLSLQDAG
jgi:AraC-like DNA-binding protein